MSQRPANGIALLVCVASAACAIVYLVPPPGPRYYPLEDLWRMENIAGQPSMGWYSHMLAALIAGVTAGIIGWIIIRSRPATARALRVTVLLTGLTLAAVAALLTWRELWSA